jgi:cystathionine gamma-synthase
MLLQVLKERTVSLFFSESPTNPYLRCVDVPRISQLCRSHGALVVIDSTFATPVNQRVRPASPFLILDSSVSLLLPPAVVPASCVGART